MMHNRLQDREETYGRLIRMASLIMGVLLLLVSLEFSKQGFSFETHSAIDLVGYVLGVAGIVLELIFNQRGFKSLTLGVLGCLAYLYGVYTNIRGVWVLQGMAEFATLTDALFVLPFPAVLGLILEVAPEPMILFGLGIGMTGGRDLVSQLLGRADDDDEKARQLKLPLGQKQPYYNAQQQPQQPQHNHGQAQHQHQHQQGQQNVARPQTVAEKHGYTNHGNNSGGHKPKQR